MAPVTITYTSHPAPSQPINQAIKSLRDQLPLRNLHWKPSTRTSLRTIQEIGVDLVELGDVPTGGRSGLSSVLEQPLVNLCIVVCEDSETYKNSTKSFIRDWLSLLSSRRGAIAPLIVLVNPPTAIATSGKNVFGRDKGVLGKLKSDFNTGKRDRCVQVNLPAEGRDDPAAWPEVVNKIKESVVLAFDAAIVEREDEVKRGEAQRMMVGWNFCTWFLLKESLAHSFEAVGLPSDALVIYEELEATFFQILKEQNLSWFGKLGATSPKDDSLPVLDIRNKPYREMLQGSAISIFDFRVYVFARQARLLGLLGRITEVAKRGQWFVASLTRRLRESEDDLAEHFIESWTYTACMDIVQNCDEWSRIDRPNSDYAGLVAYESARSELLDIARVQVERIGVAAGHLPNAYPFAAASALVSAADDVLFESSETGSLPDEPAAEVHTRPRISNAQLVHAMNDAAAFQSLYVSLTETAILAYEACGKVNSIIRLRTDLAALALHITNWQEAYDMCCATAKECAQQSVWSPIAKFALEGAIRSHRELGLDKAEEWTFIALAYLRVCALLPEGQEAIELQAVMDGLRAGESSADPVLEHEAFQICIPDEIAREGATPDFTTVTLEITNNLPTPISISDLSTSWSAPQREPMLYASADATLLQPGLNTLPLTCRTLAHGIYYSPITSFKIGSVRFSYGSSQAVAQQLLVRRARGGVQVKLVMPTHIALDDAPAVIVQVQSHGCAMRDVGLRVRDVDLSAQFDLSGATCDGASIELEDGSLKLGNLDADTTKEIMIPFVDSPHGDVAGAHLDLSYTASDGQISRWVDVQKVRVALPLTVNVQDFFRPECLVSQFTIAADGNEALRIAYVELRPPASGYEVDSCSRAQRSHQVVTPNEPLSRIFRVRPNKQTGDAGQAVLRLVIQYMTVEDEVVDTLESVLSSDVPADIARAVRRRMHQRHLWMAGYLSSGWSAAFPPAWKAEVASSAPRKLDEEIEAFTKRVSSLKLSPTIRTLEIPVDVPSRRVLTTVQYSHSSPGKSPMYEGRAISINVKMRTSFTWAGEVDEHSKTGKMVYDILPSPDDWLVLGMKKGFYELETGSGETAVEREIVLVPMRAGRLFLPAINVNLIQTQAQGQASMGDGLISETYVDNAVEAMEILPAKSGGVALIPLESSWEVETERRM